MATIFRATLVTLTVLAALSARADEHSVAVLRLAVNNVSVVDGGLVASGSVGRTNFTLPLKLATPPTSPDPTCPILNLQIPQGIHLTLLGLNIDTSGICLSITAQSGAGLLGDLLCNIANQLGGGTPLSTILNRLNDTQRSTLDEGLTRLLNSVLIDATTVTSVLANGQIQSLTSDLGATASVDPANCTILHLSLGPVSLNLLGLMIQLDNCQNGPITVDITATPGPGDLLGDLLCNLADLLKDDDLKLAAIERTLLDIARQIQRLI